MKKEYTNPEIIITSYEADSEIMLNTPSLVQTNYTSTDYTSINF